jgi:hypothetical protein
MIVFMNLLALAQAGLRPLPPVAAMLAQALAKATIHP